MMEISGIFRISNPIYECTRPNKSLEPGCRAFPSEGADGRYVLHGVYHGKSNTIYLKRAAYTLAMEHMMEAMKMPGWI